MGSSLPFWGNWETHITLKNPMNIPDHHFAIDAVACIRSNCTRKTECGISHNMATVISGIRRKMGAVTVW
jgi:hypothetical protein